MAVVLMAAAVVVVVVRFGIAGGNGTCWDIVRGRNGVGAFGRTGVATVILGEFENVIAGWLG